MGRAAHNYRRKQKLIEKHTGRPYAPRGGKGDTKGQGKKSDKSWQNAWWREDWSDNTWTDEASHKSSGEPRKLKKKVKTKAGVSEKELDGKKKKLKGKTKKAETTTGDKKSRVKAKLLKRKRLKDEGQTSKVDGKVKRLKLKKKGGVLAEPEDVAPTKRKKKKNAKKSEGDMPEVEEPKPKKISKKALRRERLRERMKLRHSAYIICPGSITERFARGPLNGNERRLLASGGLSWRWFREARADDELVPLNPKSTSLKPGHVLHDADALRPNHQEHGNELWTRQQSLSRRAADALMFFDKCLESDASWPPCVARVVLASRLQATGGIQRRCVSYLSEVVEPLLADGPMVASSKTEESKTDMLIAEARQLCLRCAQKWSTQEFEMKKLKSIWLGMLKRALAPPRPDAEAKGDSEGKWLHALRVAILSRLCPRKDDDGQAFLLRSVATAAADAGAGQKDSALIMIPLGVFTFWQALFLVLMAQSLGMAATVVRRRADGTPQVIFRCAES